MVAEKKKVDFTQGRLFPKILAFILPIVATNLLQVFYNAADMMVVSLSSEQNAVGAIGTTGSFINLIVNIFIGFSVGANVVVARTIGAKDEESVQKAVHTSLIMAVLFGVFGAGIGIAVSRLVLEGMGNTGSLLELAVTYTYIYFAGVPFLALTNYLIAIFRAKGDSKTPLIVLALAGLLNVALNFFFVVVVGLSVEGVAIATAASNLASFIVLLVKLGRDRDYTTFSFKKLKIDRKSMKEIVRIGLPAGLQGALFSLSNMLIQSSIVSVNNSVCPPTGGSDYQPVVNGSAAAGNLEGFAYTAMNAVHQGAITFTSQNMGAEKPERVRPILYNSYLIVTVIGLLFGLAIYFFREPLLALYDVKAGAAGSLETIALETAATRLGFVCLPYFLCGLMDVGSGVLRGLGKSAVSTVICLVGSCLLRVVWLTVFFPMDPTLEMIFICYPITWFLTAATLFVVVQIIVGNTLKVRKTNERSEGDGSF